MSAGIRTTNLDSDDSSPAVEVLVHALVGGVPKLRRQTLEVFIERLLVLAGLDPSSLIDISARLQAEIARAQGIEGGLRTDLTAETNVRIAAVQSLITSLNQEATARTKADSDEATLRVAGDNAQATALTNAVQSLVMSANQEAGARVAGDIAQQTTSLLLDQANWSALGPAVARTRVPVYDTGELIEARFQNGSSGFAAPFIWDGTPISLFMVAYSCEAVGVPLRASLWSADRTTMLASRVFYSETGGLSWGRFNRRLESNDAPAGPLYFALDVVGGAVQLQGHVIPDFQDVPNPAAYPQLYTTTAAPKTDLKDWLAVGGNTGFPLRFALYDATPTSARPRGPSADKLMVTPRLFGMTGIENNVYLRNLRSGQSQRDWTIVGPGGSFGNLLTDRWTYTPAAAATDLPLRIRCYDPDNGAQEQLSEGTYSVSIVDSAAAAGASRRILCIGDSLTAASRWPQRILDNAALYPQSVQPTLLGTQGSGSNKHEGRSGWTISSFISAGSPFWNASNGGFLDTATYLTANGFQAPHIIIYHIGINSVATWTTDAQAIAESVADINRLDILIGLAGVGGYVPWKVSAPNAFHLICVNTAPCAEQDSFGIDYPVGTGVISRGRYVRNMAISNDQYIRHYRGRESQKIFLVPFNAVVDPVNGWPRLPYQANANTPNIEMRQVGSVHPTALAGIIGAYEQMGDQATAAINNAVVRFGA